MTQPNAARELAIARDALKKNDTKHALHHLGWALNAEPGHPEALALLETIFAGARDPLLLIPYSNRMSTADGALRAYALAYAGSIDEALRLLNTVSTTMTGPGYLSWAARWLAKPELCEKADPQTVVEVLLTLAQKYPDEPVTDPAALRIIQALRPSLLRLAEMHPQETMLSFISVILIRRSGDCEGAIALGTRAYSHARNRQSAVPLATTYRTCGQPEAAVRIFEEALRLPATENSPDSGIHLDLGDIYGEMGQYDRSLEAYQRVLDENPDHDWAKPYSLYYRYIATQDTAWKDALLAFIRTHPDNPQGLDLGARLNLPLRPYEDFLPSPSEAIINLARQVAADPNFVPGESGRFEIGLSALESPSAVLALNLFLKARGFNEVADIKVADVQRPDPRRPRGEVAFLLWEYSGTTPRPALAPPSPDVAALVSALAGTTFSLAAWKREAAERAAGLKERQILDLLAVMLHPPEGRRALETWDWIAHVQVAAAFMLAYMPTPWERETERRGLFGKRTVTVPAMRKAALHALVNGPLDWSVGAGMLALSEISLDNRAWEPETAALLMDVNRALPHTGYIPYEAVLHFCLRRLPSVPDFVRRSLD